jgi:hypothetical protein
MGSTTGRGFELNVRRSSTKESLQQSTRQLDSITPQRQCNQMTSTFLKKICIKTLDELPLKAIYNIADFNNLIREKQESKQER